MHCLPPVNSKFHSQLCNQLLVTEVPDRTEDKSVRSIEDLVPTVPSAGPSAGPAAPIGRSISAPSLPPLAEEGDAAEAREQQRLCRLEVPQSARTRFRRVD